MSDNLDDRNPIEDTNEDADDIVSAPRRQKRRNSNEEDDTETPHVSSTEAKNELNPTGHRHALPGNKIKGDFDKNKEIRDIQQKMELKKKERVSRPRTTTKSSTSTQENSTPQPGGSQNSQESTRMPIATQPDEEEIENELTNDEKKKNENKEDPSMDV